MLILGGIFIVSIGSIDKSVLGALLSSSNATSLTGEIIKNIPQITGDAVSNTNITSENNLSGIITAILGTIFIMVILSLIFEVIFCILFYIWLLSIVYLSIYNETGGMKGKQAIKDSLKYFWNYLGLTIILGLIFSAILMPFYAGLFISALLKNNAIGILIFIVCAIITLIPAVFFGVKLLFSSFIMFKENIGIIESIKSSYELTKGKWLKTFGYLIVVSLIFSIIFLVIYGIFYLAIIIFFAIVFAAILVGMGVFALLMLLLVAIVMIVIFEVIYALYSLLPFLVSKNLYLELKAGTI
jgi:hypothetical protein